ncbi:MAG TPA: sulfotransferase [Parvularculaceae bacterium]|nr:sulfotransferase [Parvularculaceae bacterium]
MNRPPPTFILSAGRSGSTALSLALSRRPNILSVSELLMALNTQAFVHKSLSGRRFWRLLSTPRKAMSDILTPASCPKEFMYDFSRSRLFTQRTLPPILYMALPRLTDEPDVLYFELEAAICNRPPAPLNEQYEYLLSWLCDRFQKRTWVERSGASLIFAPALIRLFPNAKFIHLYRDGRDVALSMQSYPPLALLADSWRSAKRLGVDLLKQPFRLGESRLIAMADGLISPLYGADARLRKSVDLSVIGAFWSEMTLLAARHLDDVPGRQKLSVCYEDLVGAPSRTLKTIVEFIELETPSSRWLDEAAKIFRASPSRLSTLGKSELAALIEACKPGLAALGYDLPPSERRRPYPLARVENTHAPSQARSRSL